MSKLVLSCFLRGQRVLFRQQELSRKLPGLLYDFPARGYAKGKDKKKEDKVKGHKKKVQINESLLSQSIDVEKMKLEMESNLEKLRENYTKYLSLRTASGSIENMTVVYEGKKYPLIEVAQIVRNNPKTIIINMSSFPQVISAVLSALSQSGMNLNPQQDGTKIYIPVPRVTKEHRETLAKNAKAHFIKCRDGIKDVHVKYVKSLKSQEKEGLSQDMSALFSQQVKSFAEGYIQQAEEILEKKQQELTGS